jgi:hypothetical protein
VQACESLAPPSETHRAKPTLKHHSPTNIAVHNIQYLEA